MVMTLDEAKRMVGLGTAAKTDARKTAALTISKRNESPIIGEMKMKCSTYRRNRFH